jgi:hypothetical protein
MKNYSVIVSHEADDYVWDVFELGTNQVIETFYFEEDALELANFLDEGGGFDGFTPPFMLNRVKVPVTNINEEFTRVFTA